MVGGKPRFGAGQAAKHRGCETFCTCFLTNIRYRGESSRLAGLGLGLPFLFATVLRYRRVANLEWWAVLGALLQAVALVGGAVYTSWRSGSVAARGAALAVNRGVVPGRAVVRGVRSRAGGRRWLKTDYGLVLMFFSNLIAFALVVDGAQAQTGLSGTDMLIMSAAVALGASAVCLCGSVGQQPMVVFAGSILPWTALPLGIAGLSAWWADYNAMKMYRPSERNQINAGLRLQAAVAFVLPLLAWYKVGAEQRFQTLVATEGAAASHRRGDGEEGGDGVRLLSSAGSAGSAGSASSDGYLRPAPVFADPDAAAADVDRFADDDGDAQDGLQAAGTGGRATVGATASAPVVVPALAAP